MLNFNPDDAEQASFSLDQVILDTVPVASLGTRSDVASYDFVANGTYDGLFTPRLGGEETVAPSEFSATEGLLIRGSEGPTTSTIFGFWGAQTEDRFESGRIYHVQWLVGSDAPAIARAYLPPFRLRVNSGSHQLAALLHIDSRKESLPLSVDGEDQVYDLWFVAPEAIDGESICLSFDYIYAGGDDNPALSVILKGVSIESYGQEAN